MCASLRALIPIQGSFGRLKVMLCGWVVYNFHRNSPPPTYTHTRIKPVHYTTNTRFGGCMMCVHIVRRVQCVTATERGKRAGWYII